MSKRPIATTSFDQRNASKRQKTFDPYKMMELMGRLSVTHRLSNSMCLSFAEKSLSLFSETRNERINNLVDWHKIPILKENVLLDLKMALETLKIMLYKIHCSKLEDVDMKHLRSTVLFILLRLEVKIQGARIPNCIHFVKQEFGYRQTQMFSEQYHVNMEMKRSNNYITSRETLLLENDRVCNKEQFIYARQVLEMISQIASASKEFAEMMLTDIINMESSQSIPSTSDQQTMIDVIVFIGTTIIKDNRYIAKNFGVVVALSHLLRSLTSHYDKYDYLKDIDRGLEAMFTLILQLATFDVEIMLCLSQSLVNITQNDPKRMKLFKSMCISYPHTNLETSERFRLMRMDICGCYFQVFFLLLNHVFRFYDAEKITGNRLDSLIEITTNMNYLVFIFLANDVDMKFLVPLNNSGVKNACYCYRNLLYCTLILNDLMLKNQNSNPDNYFIFLQLRKESIIILNGLLNYSFNNAIFWKIIPPQLMMNEIFATIFFENLDFFNTSRTRVYPDRRKVFHFYTVDNPFNRKEPHMNPFMLFLKKFSPENGKFLFNNDEEDEYSNRRSSRPLKYPGIKMSKEDLLNELADNFNADILSVYSFNKS